jgi:tetratricopeptide (TPR) repeat protein
MRYLYFALLALLFAAPAQAEWWVAETDHFVVYSESNAKDARAFAENLERFARAMRTMQNMPITPGKKPGRVTIYRTGTMTDIGRLYGDASSGVAGFYIPRASGSVAFAPAREERSRTPGVRDDDRQQLDSEGILFHEYAHSFMLQHFPAAYPAWYVEGFAEVYSTAKFLDNGVFRIGDPAYHRANQLLYDRPFPVKKLFEAKVKPEDTRHYYSVGWLLTHYLTFSPHRRGQLQRYLEAVNKGVPSDAAARQTFGDLDALNDELMKYMNSRLIGVEVKPANYVPPRVDIRQLTDAEAAIMPLKIRSDRGVDKKSAIAVASDARERAQRYPNDPFVQTELAEAELDADNLAAAEAAAKRALAADPASVDALNFLGQTEMKRAEKDPSHYATARSWFVKANHEDPDNAEALVENYMAFDKSGKPVPELAIIGLEHAYELAPFDPGVRLVLARQLLRENRGKSARALLFPLAYSAHGEKIREAAEKMLASIERNDLKAAIATASEQIDKADNEDDGKKGGKND